jgi:hypothetical protein
MCVLKTHPFVSRSIVEIYGFTCMIYENFAVMNI